MIILDYLKDNSFMDANIGLKDNDSRTQNDTIDLIRLLELRDYVCEN